jgi:hypothetical protein
VVANLGPEVVPDATSVYLGGLMKLSAGEYRELAARLGSPPGTRPKNPDGAVVELLDIKPVPVAPSTTEPCRPLGNEAVAVPKEIDLRGGASVAAVQVRRFGSGWVDIGHVGPGEEVRVTLPGLLAAQPWQVRAEGACRAEPAPITSSGAPVDGTELSGTVTLGAAAAAADAEAVELRITGGSLHDEPIGAARHGVYGWLLRWDTTSVPDGTYQLTAVERDRSGAETISRPVTVTVRN